MGKDNLKKHSLRSEFEDSEPATIKVSGVDNEAYEASEKDPNDTTKHLRESRISTSDFVTKEPLNQMESGPYPLKGGSQANSQQSQEGEKSLKDLVHITVEPNVTHQVVAAMVMSLAHLAIGSIYGYSGVTLPELTDPSTPDLFLNAEQAANYGSISDLGAVFGCILGTMLLVKLGQRASMLLGLPIAAAAWIGLGFSHNAVMLQAMRFLVGMNGSFLSPAGSMYVLEVSHKSLRGLLFGVVTTMRGAGTLFVYAVGSMRLGWRVLSFVCAGLTFLPIVCLFFLPNSPRWLVTQGRSDEAMRSLTFYRGKKYDSKEEISEIMEQVGQNAKEKNGFMAQAKMLLEPATLRSLLLIIFISVLGNFSGYTVVTAYAVPILLSAKVKFDAYLSATLISAVRVAGTIVHLAIVDRLGRKSILVSSYIVCSVCLSIFGGYFYMQNNLHDVSHLGWVPLACLVVFVFFTGIGQPVVFILQGELLPTSSRGAGISIITTAVFLGGFSATRTYSVITAAIGEHGAFWFYCGVCLTIALIGFLCLPETRGRSLEDITDRHHPKNEKSDGSVNQA